MLLVESMFCHDMPQKGTLSPCLRISAVHFHFRTNELSLGTIHWCLSRCNVWPTSLSETLCVYVHVWKHTAIIGFLQWNVKKIKHVPYSSITISAVKPSNTSNIAFYKTTATCYLVRIKLEGFGIIFFFFQKFKYGWSWIDRHAFPCVIT